MYFLITKHLHKTFIAKIKVDHRKWPSFVINASECFFSSQNRSKWATKDQPFQAIYNEKKTVLQNNEK